MKTSRVFVVCWEVGERTEYQTLKVVNKKINGAFGSYYGTTNLFIGR